MNCVLPLTLTKLAGELPSDYSEIYYPGPLHTAPTSIAAAMASCDDLDLSLLGGGNFGGPDSMSSILNWRPQRENSSSGNSLEYKLEDMQASNGQQISPQSDDRKFDSFHSQKDPHESASQDVRSSNSSNSLSRSDKVSLSKRHVKQMTSPDKLDNEKSKREKHLKRNRMAAKKCRQKKREEKNNLESRLKTQSELHWKLSSEIRAMRSEILTLKNEVLEHSRCDDERLRGYLVFMEQKIARRSSSISSMASSIFEDPAASTQQHLSPISESSFHLDLSEEQKHQNSKASPISEVSWESSVDDYVMNLVNV